MTDIIEDKLARRWSALWDRLAPQGVEGCQETFAYLAWLHNDPRRHYHTFTHILGCMLELEAARADGVAIDNPDLVEFALFLHDAIYETQQSANEVKSLNLARQILIKLEVPHTALNSVGEHIMATSHKIVSRQADTQLVVDIDLAILGYPERMFDEYEVNIREEYKWCNEHVFCVRRLEILNEFYGRWPLYKTEYFSRKYEATARKNLSRSMDQLNNRIIELHAGG